MFRRFVSMRGLCQVMTGIDLSMSSKRAMTLRTVGSTSAVTIDVGELTALCDQARCCVNGMTLTDLSVCKKPQPELLPLSDGDSSTD
ncbi:Hypothetical protein, putative [Bodo saltans]|uniref:Uncharacterized protein n=1 Tax=Bodo saltans TaxID=75058 RepID=A0A0S4IP12_BODSA|nr:Hypothetical protein, putative [Bodo saltans]|eukprot:CUF77463.1 Hypothetical protein, putative [Bodo saltans]